VAGVHACIPKQVIDNAHFEAQFGAESVADVVKMVGVHQRRWAEPEVTGGDLTLAAAQALLASLAWAVNSIDAIVYISQTPDYRMPATACVLQHRLGLPAHCAAFDMNLGCSAYPYGLWLAMSLLQASGLKRALVCVSETMSKILDHSDRATALLFGDAATVTALEADAADRISNFVLGTDGAGFDNLIIADGARGAADPVIAEKQLTHPGKLHMDGWSVFNFTIGTVPKLVSDTLAQAALDVDAIDYFLFHQANAFMLDHLRKKSKLPQEKVLRNIAKYGNTSCASIPLLMATELGSISEDRPLTLAMIGFGVGYSWSSAILRIDAGTPLGLIEA
jgi:3-oxoacyl-[acyl-carrier-protein] synthase-3